jgi:hypothetical protein
VAHFGLKSTEAYGKFPNSTESVFLALLQLCDKKTDSKLLQGTERLEGVVGKPVGVQVTELLN